jgi:hypothetical protein
VEVAQRSKRVDGRSVMLVRSVRPVTEFGCQLYDVTVA